MEGFLKEKKKRKVIKNKAVNFLLFGYVKRKMRVMYFNMHLVNLPLCS